MSKEVVLDVDVIEVTDHYVVIDIPELGTITQVRKYPSPEQQVEAINTAVREVAYLAISANVRGLEKVR